MKHFNSIKCKLPKSQMIEDLYLLLSTNLHKTVRMLLLHFEHRCFISKVFAMSCVYIYLVLFIAQSLTMSMFRISLTDLRKGFQKPYNVMLETGNCYFMAIIKSYMRVRLKKILLSKKLNLSFLSNSYKLFSFVLVLI